MVFNDITTSQGIVQDAYFEVNADATTYPIADLTRNANTALDTVVSEYEKFLELLEVKLKSFKNGDELPIAKFLERDVRRVQGGLSAFETQLVTDIGAGKFTKLMVGKMDKYGRSPTKLQHFILQ